MLEHLPKRFDLTRLVVVVDCGLLSLDNIAQIRALALEKQRQVDFRTKNSHACADLLSGVAAASFVAAKAPACAIPL